MKRFINFICCIYVSISLTYGQSSDCKMNKNPLFGILDKITESLQSQNTEGIKRHYLELGTAISRLSSNTDELMASTLFSAANLYIKTEADSLIREVLKHNYLLSLVLDGLMADYKKPELLGAYSKY